MKVLVCGSRNYTDGVTLFKTMDRIAIEHGPITEIIEGEARGADTFARVWAEYSQIAVRKFPAPWAKFGKGAGPIRNKQMLEEGKPDLVVAFPKNGNLAGSKGTLNMVNQARGANVRVIVVGTKNTVVDLT